MSVVTTISDLVQVSNSQFLEEENFKLLQATLRTSAKELSSLTVKDQEVLLQLAMENFGVFVALTLAAESLPAILRYALISKSMYNFGACDLPKELEAGVNAILAVEQRSWWGNTLTDDLIYNFRERLVSSPIIGIEPLAGEFPNSGDLSLLAAMLQNPLLPKGLVKTIVDRSHSIFENEDEENLEDLIDLAEEALNE